MEKSVRRLSRLSGRLREVVYARESEKIGKSLCTLVDAVRRDGHKSGTHGHHKRQYRELGSLLELARNVAVNSPCMSSFFPHSVGLREQFTYHRA